MRKIENILKSDYYIIIIFLFTLISWSFYKDTPPYSFNLLNMIGVFILLGFLCFLMVSFDNTLYTVPVIISFLFIINKSDLTFSNTSTIGFPLISVSLLITSFIFHLIRFKPSLRCGRFCLGLFLIALSYVIPLIYLPFDISAIPVSVTGFVYLFFYVFILSTSKSNLDYLFKIMLYANLLLSFQVLIYAYHGYMTYTDLNFLTRLFLGWIRNLGWANVNDMCFYISMTFPSYFYMLFKKPKAWYLWLLMLIPITAVILTKSRIGIFTFAFSAMFSILYYMLRGPKKPFAYWIKIIAVPIVLFIITFPALVFLWNILLSKTGGDLNDFTANRLYMYEQGLLIFLRYPVFGGGWLSISSFPFEGRLFMFHSTFIQALATMGLFGLLALIIHYKQIYNYFSKNITLEKSLFIIGYLATQLHGLVDNVQYAVPYSVLLVLFIAIFETSSEQSIFIKTNNRYVRIGD